MASFLKKGLRAGFGTISKGLYSKYEHELKEEEAEADLLRKQNLAVFEDKLLSDRAIKLAKKEQELTLDTQRKSALQKGEIEEEIAIRDAGKLHDSMAEREDIGELPSKEEFQRDMLFIHRASKGSTPLNNDQKIEIIKNANEAWDKMSTLGGPEYDELVAKHGTKARQKFIEREINNSLFGGTSQVDKASKIISQKKQKDIIKEIKSGDPEEMVKKIMKTQKVNRDEATVIYADIMKTQVLSPDKTKKRAGFLDQIGARFNVEEDIPEKVEKPSFLDYNL